MAVHTLDLTEACSLAAFSISGARYRCRSWWSFSSLFATPKILNSTLSTSRSSRCSVDNSAMVAGQRSCWGVSNGHKRINRRDGGLKNTLQGFSRKGNGMETLRYMQYIRKWQATSVWRHGWDAGCGGSSDSFKPATLWRNVSAQKPWLSRHDSLLSPQMSFGKGKAKPWIEQFLLRWNFGFLWICFKKFEETQLVCWWCSMYVVARWNSYPGL